MANGNILLPFGIFFPVLVFCTKKNLATLDSTPAATAGIIASYCGITTSQLNFSFPSVSRLKFRARGGMDILKSRVDVVNFRSSKTLALWPKKQSFTHENKT
jgi:hypothetical protein